VPFLGPTLGIAGIASDLGERTVNQIAEKNRW